MVENNAEVPNDEETNRNEDSIIVPIQPIPTHGNSIETDGSSEGDYCICYSNGELCPRDSNG